jgi:DNA uptake protein ComE-like DNA-binding protein
MYRSFAPAVVGTLILALLGACGGGEEGTPQPVEEAPVAAAPAAPTMGAGATTGAFLDPNEATREELVATAGIDAATADALIAGRPYNDMVAVDRVLGERLGEEQRDSVYTRLWRPIDLNAASAEEILLIPGVGERMQHEFEEYRPYRGIEQFRREIGKYVDENEVARLERYVTIR